MKFDDLDQKMRRYETAADLCVLPGLYMVARIDGRSFTRLTKDVCQFKAPFDERFRDLMVATRNCDFAAFTICFTLTSFLILLHVFVAFFFILSTQASSDVPRQLAEPVWAKRCSSSA